MSAINSVPSPLHRVRNTTLYYYRPPNNFPSLKRLLRDSLIRDELMHPIARAAARIATLYFCRISEVLNLRVGDIFYPDRIICRGSKRGDAYIMYLPQLSQQLVECSISSEEVRLFPITYTKCYRSFVRAGIRHHRPGKKNTMRCHSGRYLVNQMLNDDIDLNVISKVLHHKSKSSVFYYL